MESEERPPEEPHPDEPREEGEPIPIPTPGKRHNPQPSEETTETPDDDLVDRAQGLMREGISQRSPKL
jgi:hypothetical protein